MSNKNSKKKSKSFRYFLGSGFLKVFGWSIKGESPKGSKYIMVAAPHTSNWDLPFMLATTYVLGMSVSWVGKHTIFRGPLGWFLERVGGIPVDRTSRHGAVDQIVERFNQSEHLILGIAPSGTRKKKESWKSGFYWMAYKAEIPILLGYLDYKNKEACIGKSIMPTGDLTHDMDIVREFYSGITGKYPTLTSRIRLLDEHLAEK